MKFIYALLFLFLFPAAVSAADIKIIEVQTEGIGGALDECVKVKNNASESFSLLGLILQSRGASSTSTWQSRSGTGLPDINIEPGETIILASKDYIGDAVWKHTASWRISSDGGGMRIVVKNKDGSIAETFAEKYWDNSEPEPQSEPTIETPAREETPPTPEPAQEIPAGQPNNTTSDILSPLPANAEEIPIPVREINIQISEFIPNPSGSDDGEWIEIKNLLDEDSDISGWFLDDEDGGSNPYKIPENTIIPANGFLVFYKIQTKLALNNDTDSARILKPTGEIMEKVDYSGCADGLSFARGTDKWSWTTSPTPSLANIITAPSPKKSSAKNTNQASAKQKTEEASKNKILSEGISTENKNQNLKYYTILGIGLCAITGIEGWKRREFLKTKYKQIFNKENNVV